MTSSSEQVRAWRQRKLGTEPPYHGTAHIYNAYGCRCSECRAGAASAARRFYWRRRAHA